MAQIVRSPETEAEWTEYYDLRYRVLRAPLGKERGSERNELDDTEQHFALFVDGAIMAIGRMDHLDETTKQVRFVAVENRQGGRGYGRKIMQAIEEAAKAAGANKIILQAREISIPFYLKMGYLLMEKTHLLFGLVQHYRMEKSI